MLMGMNGFVWWQGVVENRMDPLELGRCQVRILGLHSERKSSDLNRGIPTDQLPWAYPVGALENASMNGIGQTPLGPVEGTWVFGFFRDGEQAQDPMMLGTLGGIPAKMANPNDGFNDPNGKYPKFTNEPDTNRLARGVTAGTVIGARTQQAVETPDGNWTEPASPYSAKYPYNHVYESESGHVREFDDTPGAERIHTCHKSGTFEEIHPDGTKVTKIIGTDYEIVLNGKNAYVSGALNVTITGDANIKVGGKTTVESSGHAEVRAPSIDVGIIGMEPAVLGNKYQSQINHILDIFNEHKHPGSQKPMTVMEYKEARSGTVNVQS